MLRLLVVLLAALAVAPATADAGWKVDRATAIANVVWHSPCGGHPTLHWTSGDVSDGAVADADPNTCEIDYAADADNNEWPRFCTTTLHEWGHLAGYRDPTNVDDPAHSSNPRSVMYQFRPTVKTVSRDIHGRTSTHWYGIDPRCADNGRPYLEKHGLLTSRRTRPTPAPNPTPQSAGRPTDPTPSPPS